MTIYQHDTRDGGRMRLGQAVAVTDAEWASLRPDTTRPALPAGAVIVRYDSATGRVTASDGQSQLNPSGFDTAAADVLLADTALLTDLQALRSPPADQSAEADPAAQAIAEIEDAAHDIRSAVAARHSTQIANYEKKVETAWLWFNRHDISPTSPRLNAITVEAAQVAGVETASNAQVEDVATRILSNEAAWLDGMDPWIEGARRAAKEQIEAGMDPNDLPALIVSTLTSMEQAVDQTRPEVLQRISAAVADFQSRIQAKSRLN
ncbi:MAG: hypothetical protein Alpg2KO_18430 [Alphaproteobacteria bacterium]